MQSLRNSVPAQAAATAPSIEALSSLSTVMKDGFEAMTTTLAKQLAESQALLIAALKSLPSSASAQAVVPLSPVASNFRSESQSPDDKSHSQSAVSQLGVYDSAALSKAKNLMKIFLFLQVGQCLCVLVRYYLY